MTHILQYSISCLIPLIYLSYSLEKYIYAIILTSNLCISVYVHRYNRLETYELEDKIDICCITIWIVKNIYEIVLLIYNTQNVLYTFYILLLAFINVYNCLNFNNLRQNYKWRTNDNIENHIKMQLSGILGTYVLIVSSY